MMMPALPELLIALGVFAMLFGYVMSIHLTFKATEEEHFAGVLENAKGCSQRSASGGNRSCRCEEGHSEKAAA
jgi:hypothetical protein